jgi:hypothetical protein
MVNVSFQYGTTSGVYTAETAAQEMSAPGPFFTAIDMGSGFAGQAIYFRARGVCSSGTAYGAENSYSPMTPPFISLQPPSGGASVAPPGQPAPVGIPNITVQSASLSAAKVAPGAPVTVSASVANKGTVNGAARISLLVNGREEIGQGITVNSGSNTPVTFTISRGQPGTYVVHVGGVSAGSFTVDEMADANIILYISVAFIFIALVMGALLLLKRRQPGY